jgi:hypothetical protein
LRGDVKNSKEKPEKKGDTPPFPSARAFPERETEKKSLSITL